MSIPEIVNVPNRAQPTITFNNNNFLFFQQLNAFVDACNAAGVTVEDGVTAALAALASAEAASDEIAVTANYQGEWSTLTGAQSAGISATHNGFIWILSEDVADVTAVEPGVGPLWVSPNLTQPIRYIGASGSGSVTSTASSIQSLATVPELPVGAPMLIRVRGSTSDLSGSLIERVQIRAAGTALTVMHAMKNTASSSEIAWWDLECSVIRNESNYRVYQTLSASTSTAMGNMPISWLMPADATAVDFDTPTEITLWAESSTGTFEIDIRDWTVEIFS